MAWDTEIIEMVRYMIGDIDEPYKYSDARIKKAAIISANYLVNECYFPNNYVIDITNSTITPDPTTTDPRDADFMNLLAIKTSCLILQGEVKIYANSSLRVTDGPSTIDIGSTFTNTQKALNDLLAMYSLKLNYYKFGAANYGTAVTTPSTYPGL